jgi:transposase
MRKMVSPLGQSPYNRLVVPRPKETNQKEETMDKQYDHYVALEWSEHNMVIARMSPKMPKVKLIDVPPDIGELKRYLRGLSGRKILVIEETTTSQWLYTELVGEVDRLVICDPYRNRLLSEGPKNDPIDAGKLVHLLRSGMLKEVYHGQGAFVELRRLVSGYEDVVRAGVRLQNQRAALLRACGRSGGSKERLGEWEAFVLEGLEKRILDYEEDKAMYEKKFAEAARQHSEIRHQMKIPGIGPINSVKIAARVINAGRFPDNGHYWSYCGLIKHDKMSGGRSYGKRQPRYCRELKGVYKTAALSAINGDNEMRRYYDHLMNERGKPERDARNAVARRIAQISLGVLRSGKPYRPRERRIGEKAQPGS